MFSLFSIVLVHVCLPSGNDLDLTGIIADVPSAVRPPDQCRLSVNENFQTSRLKFATRP